MTHGWQTSNNCTFTITQRGYLGVGIATPDGSSNITPSDVSGYYFMVCRGDYSSTMTYEPYTGGIASPNPDYPQDVQVVTGLNKVKIIGKNISYCSQQDSTAGITFEVGNEINIVNPTSYNYCDYWNLRNNPIYSGKTYTVYAMANGTVGSVGLSLNIAKTGNAYAFQSSYTANTTYTNHVKVGTITLGANEQFTSFYVYNSNTTTTNLNIKVMIVEGSYTETTIGDYEPYKEQPFEINLGTNKFDYTKISSVTSGTNDNGVITSSTNSEAGLKNVIIWFSSGAIKIPANTTVYFSADIRLSSSSIGSAGNMNDGNNNSTKTVNPSLNRSYQRYQAYINYSTDTTINSMLFQVLNLVGSFEIKNIMISFQDEINYQPYFEPIELCKSTSRQDYIHKIGNDWYIHEAVKKINLDNVFYNGTYLWPNGAWIVKNKITNQTLTDCAKDNGAQLYCNYLETKPYNTVLNGGIGIAPIVGTGEMFVNFGITSSIADNMTFLENHNVKVYYPLATPNEILITEPSLINQLNALVYDGQSYYDVTNIMTEGQVLAPIITVDALEKI